MSESIDNVDAVQLSFVNNVSREILAAEGGRLRDFFPAGRLYDVNRGMGDMLRDAPSAGWRTIGVREAGDMAGRAEHLAAPHPTELGAWTVMSMAEKDGRWIVSMNPFPVTPVPGKAARRKHLRALLLECSCPAGLKPVLRPTLTNVGTDVWRNVAEDGPTVLAWILDDDGNPIFTPGFMFFAGGGALPDLQPGETIELDQADLKTTDVESFPPGDYRVIGVLDDLQLRSEPSDLHIT